MEVRGMNVYMGGDVSRAAGSAEIKKGGKQGLVVNGNALNLADDPIAERREQARKKAMNIIGRAFGNERKIDEDLAGRREKIESLRTDVRDAKSAIKELEKRRADLRDEYGVSEDSEEERELKLLEKEIDKRMPGFGVYFLGFEEEAEIKRLKERGLTDYQKRSLEIKEYEVVHAKDANDAGTDIKIENNIIKATRQERAKSHAMRDAEKEADAVMDNANEEIMSMLTDEALSHIDEEQEKRTKEAKEHKEAKEELEERIEKTREKKKEQEKLTEDILDGISDVENSVMTVGGAQEEIKDMMSKMRILEEDIKGAAVDENL